MSDVSISVSEAIDAYYGELRSFARRRLGNAAAADDLVQEAFLRLSSVAIAEVKNPRAFLYRIIGNLLIDHGRQENVRARHFAPLDQASLEFPDLHADTERQVAARQDLVRLSEAVAELPPRCRECFILRRFDDLSQDEIAERMGISRNMVEKHLRRALMHCAERLHSPD